MKMNELYETYYSTLKCKIFVLGGCSEGESIVFLLYGDEKIVYSCVVDSFEDKQNKGNSITKDFLHNLGINKLDALFWTHPHDDHSAGVIDLIDSFSPEYVYVAVDLIFLDSNYKKLTDLSKETLEKINGLRGFDGRTSAPKVMEVLTNLPLKQTTLNVGTQKVDFHIIGIAPANGKVRQNIASRNKSFSLNEFSTVINICVGDFSLLLTGDIQDDMISWVKEQLFENVPTPNILKIPHHGSESSLHILDFFEMKEKINVSVSTTKTSSHLPKKTALNYYGQNSEKLFIVDPNTKSDAIWGVEVDIMKAYIKRILCENYMGY